MENYTLSQYHHTLYKYCHTLSQYRAGVARVYHHTLSQYRTHEYQPAHDSTGIALTVRVGAYGPRIRKDAIPEHLYPGTAVSLRVVP
eukprot:2144711-Rhodomonas_salina.2